ncbi:hypothetical protein KIW84_050312 [Lathyrus oleraceus]|uniref:DUF7745 domain-containing protein n=1 Tax=Pisum sativum TaxID=3888 RepID=A0A9D5AEG5_PEA|nr:hypothetical protein KIW84_050312 [Pisum sativum]
MDRHFSCKSIASGIAIYLSTLHDNSRAELPHFFDLPCVSDPVAYQSVLLQRVEASPPRRGYVSSGGHILTAQSEDPEAGNLLLGCPVEGIFLLEQNFDLLYVPQWFSLQTVRPDSCSSRYSNPDSHSGFSGSPKMEIGRKRHVAYKFPMVCSDPIQHLMKLMDHDSLERFRKDYGLILSFITVLPKDQHDALFTLLQFYDPPLSMVASATYLGKSVLKCNMCQKGGVSGFHLSFLVGEAKKKLEDGDWRCFNVVLALCVYGIVMFPNVAKFVDVDAICLFVLGNSVPTLLEDFFHSVHHRNENRKGGVVNCCAPLFHKWFSSYLPKSGAFVDVKDSLSWSKRLMGIRAKDISWWSDQNLLRADIIHSCGNFPNVPLVGRRGGINYNPSLAVRQFGYALRTPPLEKDMEESMFFHSSSDLTVSHKATEAWLKVIKRGRTVLGKGDCRTYP